MARISSAEEPGGYIVAVTGSLKASDLRRLERACGPAIEQRRPLHIVLAGGWSMDAASRAYVERLEHHGAVVTTGWQDVPPGMQIDSRADQLPEARSAPTPSHHGEDVMTIQFQHVLCPVDYSDFSRRALDHAAAIARWYGAELTVVHAVPLAIPAPVIPPAEMAVLVERPPDPVAAEAELRDFVTPVRDAGTPVVTMVVSGPVLAGITGTAADTHADIIVMGSHGRSGFERVLLGSMAERVLHAATCPVLIVPRRADRQAREEVLFKSILCPLDFSEASRAALDYALSLAKASDGHLTLVHALEAIEEEPWIPSSFSVPEYRRLREQEAHRSLERLVPAGASDWCQPETLVVTGKAYREILRMAEEKEADLIVMGVQGRNPMGRMFLGSTAHHVVRYAQCPVLTIRPRAL